VLGAALQRVPRESHTTLVSLSVVLRTVAHLHVSTSCTATPLSCGPPLGYLDYAMLGDLGSTALLSAVAFGGAAAALDALHSRDV
jgi:hypothetical protein